MHATLYKPDFLEIAQKFHSDCGISITLGNGELLVTSFSQGISFRMPAYVLSGGQIFLMTKEWNDLLTFIENSGSQHFDIKFRQG